MFKSPNQRIAKAAVSCTLVSGLLVGSMSVAGASGRSNSVVTDRATIADITEVADAVLPDGRIVKIKNRAKGRADYVVIMRTDGKRVRLYLDDDLTVVTIRRTDNGRADRKAARRAVRAAASEAALAAVPGATVRKIEKEDDYGATYEVTVIDANGIKVEVYLDAGFNVISVKAESGSDHDRDDDDRDDDDRDDHDRDDDRNDSDRITDTNIVAAASRAALAVVPGATIKKVERENDYGSTYKVEVINTRGQEVEVYLDAQYNVLRTEVDS